MAEYIMRESGYPGRLETEIVGELIRCKDCKHFAGEGMYCACDIMVHYDHFYKNIGAHEYAAETYKLYGVRFMMEEEEADDG